ncbi:MAG: ApaG domain, partial [Oceanospirillales bacterium]
MNTPSLDKNIQISIDTAYLTEQSDPEAHRYVFSYHITITNHNAFPVQLISRRWLITDGNEQTQEVNGEGVVG